MGHSLRITAAVEMTLVFIVDLAIRVDFYFAKALEVLGCFDMLNLVLCKVDTGMLYLKDTNM